MAIELTEDVKLLRETLLGFVATEVEPLAGEIEQKNAIPDQLLARARELGLFGLSIPEEYGGLGPSEVLSCTAVEAMSHGPGGFSFYAAPNAPAVAIRLCGSEAQKSRYLPSLADGTWFAAFCLSEPSTGSDAGGIKTKAVRKDGKWVINGRKIWISRAARASVFLVSAVTGTDDRGKPQISIFLLDKRPGLEVGPADRQIGGSGSGSAEVSFADCVASDNEVIGEVGKGFDTLKSVLGRARLWAAARSTGIISRALALSLEYSSTRVQFCQKIGDFQLIKAKIADMAADLYTARLLLYQAADLYDRGEDPAQEAAYAKLFCSEAAGRASDQAIQIHGAMGLVRGLPVERLFRDARSYRILDGTSEIQRLMIASRVQRNGVGEGLAPGGLS